MASPNEDDDEITFKMPQFDLSKPPDATSAQPVGVGAGNQSVPVKSEETQEEMAPGNQGGHAANADENNSEDEDEDHLSAKEKEEITRLALLAEKVRKDMEVAETALNGTKKIYKAMSDTENQIVAVLNRMKEFPVHSIDEFPKENWRVLVEDLTATAGEAVSKRVFSGLRDEILLVIGLAISKTRKRLCDLGNRFYTWYLEIRDPAWPKEMTHIRKCIDPKLSAKMIAKQGEGIRSWELAKEMGISQLADVAVNQWDKLTNSEQGAEARKLIADILNPNKSDRLLMRVYINSWEKVRGLLSLELCRQVSDIQDDIWNRYDPMLKAAIARYPDLVQNT